MKRCEHCGSRLIVAGAREEGHAFCSADCHDAWHLDQTGSQVPDAHVQSQALQIFNAPCPLCGGDGPNDLHVPLIAMGFVVAWYSGSEPRISCATCARKRYKHAIAVCAVLGWWGLTLFLTPNYIRENLRRLRGVIDTPAEPSVPLQRFVRRNLARALVAQRAV